MLMNSQMHYYKDVNILHTNLLIQCHIPRVLCACVCVHATWQAASNVYME